MTRKIQQLSELDLQVSYLEAGTGNPLVLVHGVGMNAEAWFPQMEVLSRFYRVIAVDMPGHGESSRFRHAATLKDYVQWLASFLKTQPETSFAIAGHSMGALITAGIAIDYPQLVNHAVIISGVFKRSDSARHAVLTRAQELANGNMCLDAPLERWFSNDPHELPLKEKVGAWLQRVDPKGYARAYHAFAVGDRFYSERWNEMQCPVLVMTGELDANSNPDMTREMAQAARHGHAVVIANAKHMLNLTDAERVNEEILSFLNSDASTVSQKEPVKD